MDATEEILRRVAAGELDPDDALRLLDEPDPDQDENPSPAWGTITPDADQAGLRTTVTTVRVNASYRSVDIVADPNVAQVAVTGEHAVRHEDGVLIVDNQEDPLAGIPGMSRRGQGFSFNFEDLPRSLAWAKSRMDSRFVVRVNPELAVELDSAGANVRVSGLTGGLKLRLIASALKLENVRGPLDLDLFTSSVKGVAVPTGTSRITCESSSVRLLLGQGSDLRIRASNRMGKVVLPGSVSKAGLVEPDAAESVLGAGTHLLTIEATISSVALVDDTSAGME